MQFLLFFSLVLLINLEILIQKVGLTIGNEILFFDHTVVMELKSYLICKFDYFTDFEGILQVNLFQKRAITWARIELWSGLGLELWT